MPLTNNKTKIILRVLGIISLIVGSAFTIYINSNSQSAPLQNDNSKKNKAKTINDHQQQTNNVNLNGTQENYNVMSKDQKGGITAGKVIINNNKPKPLKSRFIEVMDKINPEILKQLKLYDTLNIVVNEEHLQLIYDIKDDLKKSEILNMEKGGLVIRDSPNNNSQIIRFTSFGRPSIFDLDDKHDMKAYNIYKLKNYNTLILNKK